MKFLLKQKTKLFLKKKRKNRNLKKKNLGNLKISINF